MQLKLIIDVDCINCIVKLSIDPTEMQCHIDITLLLPRPRVTAYQACSISFRVEGRFRMKFKN